MRKIKMTSISHLIGLSNKSTLNQLNFIPIEVALWFIRLKTKVMRHKITSSRLQSNKTLDQIIIVIITLTIIGSYRPSCHKSVTQLIQKVT
jgi:hypothetical protein